MRFFGFTHMGQVYALRVLPFVVGLLPVMFIPGSGLAAELTKSLIAAIIAGSVVTFFGASALIGSVRTLSIPRGLVFLVPFLFALVASAVLSGSSNFSWWGMVFDTGSVGFYVVFLVVVYCTAYVPVEDAVRMFKLFSAAVIVVALGSMVSIFLFENAGLFSSLAGEWPQISFLLGAVVFSWLIARSLRQKLVSSGPTSVFAVFAVLGLFMFPYTPAYIALVASILFLMTLSLLRKEDGYMSVVRTCILILISVTALFFVAKNSTFSESLPTEVHPTFLLTELVAVPALTQNVQSFVFGVGPMEFGTAWLRHYPIEINQTSFWNKQFTSGQSYFLTRIIETGILGLTGILILLGVAIRFFRGNPTVVAAVVFFVLSGFSYAIEVPMILWGACVMGLLLRDASPTILELSSRVRQSVGVVAIVIGCTVIGVSVTQLTSAIEHEKGVAQHASGDKVTSAINLERAVERWPAVLYLQDSSRVMLELGLSTPDISSEQQQELIGRSIGRIDEAIQSAPQDFNSWLIRSSLYVSLVAAGDPAVESQARASIEQAKALAPNRPDPYYIEAMLERNLGNVPAARGALETALTLKSDYIEARQLIEAL